MTLEPQPCVHVLLGIRKGTLGTHPGSENQLLALIETSPNSVNFTSSQPLAKHRMPSCRSLVRKSFGRAKVLFSLSSLQSPTLATHFRLPDTGTEVLLTQLLRCPTDQLYFKFHPAKSIGVWG